jgi:predicted ester cyclase
MGVPASGKKAETTAILITRIADGKIAEIWGLIDMMRLMQQIGATHD